MNHAHERSSLILLGGLFLFITLVALFVFEPQITGKASLATRVNITDSTPTNCSVHVGAGRSSVSWPCLSTAQSRSAIVNGTGFTAMYQYVPGTSDLWKVHNPNLPSYVVSDLTVLSRRAGYELISTGINTYSFEGLKVISTSVPLVQGWTLAGYPAFVVRNASDSFSNINNYTEARTYQNGTIYAHMNPGGGTLTYTIPGQGYWINATQGTTWTVLS